MHNRPQNMGTNARPFPNAKKSKVQLDEDMFMEIHGGIGTRATYVLANLFTLDYQMPMWFQNVSPMMVWKRLSMARDKTKLTGKKSLS